MIDLDTLQKEEHYQVPEGFFDQFPQQVMNQIRKEKTKRRNIWLSAVAAVMALVITSVTVIQYMQNDNRTQNIALTGSQDSQLEDQMVDYYSTELAQMDYLNY